MTREYAIRWLSKKLKVARQNAEDCETEWFATKSMYHTAVAVYEMAIAALREQEEQKVILVQQYIKVPEQQKGVPGTNAVKTNADHIRSMTDEELAQFLDDTQYREWEEIQECRREMLEFSSCVEGWTAWLKQPYKEDT